MSFSYSRTQKNHFIIAAPRSGTTWMSKMLNAHPQIFCMERRLFGNYADFVLDEGHEQKRLRITLDKYVDSLLLHHGLPQQKKKKLLGTLIKSIIEEEREQSGKKVLMDKITPYLDTAQNVIEGISEFFPESKIIYLVRDGRDVLTSGVFHWFNKQSAGCPLNEFEQKRKRVFLQKEEVPLERFFQDKEIEQWAREWIQPLETIGYAQHKHQVKIIKYEDLLEDTKGVLEECLTFLSTKKSNEILKTCALAGNFKLMSNGRKQGEEKPDAHVRKGISGDWENYFTRKDGQLFNEIAGEALMKFGYEEDDSWVEGLG